MLFIANMGEIQEMLQQAILEEVVDLCQRFSTEQQNSTTVFRQKLEVAQSQQSRQNLRSGLRLTYQLTNSVGMVIHLH